MIIAAAAVIAVAVFLTGDLRSPGFVWFAWIMSVLLVMLLGRRAGIPFSDVYIVSLVWGSLMLLGGLVFDDIRSGRRAAGQGIRVPWLRYPVLLGAGVVPLSLGPIYALGPATFGWSSVGAAALYFAVAYLLQMGSVTAPAYGLVAAGVVALSSWSFVAHPWRLVVIAGPMVLAASLIERAQQQDSAADGWLRWDLAPLAVGHLIAAVAFALALGNEATFATLLAFGALAVVVGIVRRRRIWIEAGNLMILASAADAGSGWLALAATALRGILGAAVSRGETRLAYQLIAVTSAGGAWVALGFWQDWSASEVVSYTALAFGALAVSVAALSRFWQLSRDSTVLWGGLGAVGVVVVGVFAIDPSGPSRVDGPWLAVGLVLLSAAFELAGDKLGSAPRSLSPVPAGGAWVALGFWQDWSASEVVSYTALAFGALAVSVAALSRFWQLSRDSTVLWGGLGAVGVVVVGVFAIDPSGPSRVDGPWLAVGLVLLSAAFELAGDKLGSAPRSLSPVPAGGAWVALGFGLGWDRPEFVTLTALSFGGLALAAGLLSRFRGLERVVVLRWGGLGAAGVALAALLAVDLGTELTWGPGVALGILMVAAAFELAAPALDPSLRYVSVAAAGISWIALLNGMGWDASSTVALTTVVFGAITILVVEAKRLWSTGPREARVLMPATYTARAWAGLGALGVLAAAVGAIGLGESSATMWAASGLAILSLSFARGAAPLELGSLRDMSAVAGLASATLFGLGLDIADAALALGVIGVAVAATFSSLSVWRRLPASNWWRPLLLLGLAADLEAGVFALQSWPDRALLVAVLLSMGVQAVAAGITFNRAGVLAGGPPIIGAGVILMIVENVGGSAQWYTIPFGLVLLSEVEILRKVLRESNKAVKSSEILVSEWLGIGLLGAPALVEMFTTGVAFGLVAFGTAGMLLLWSVATRVRRRAIAAGSLAVAAAALILFAGAAGGAPESAFFWIVAVGIGFAVMLVAALIEAYRSKKGRVMARFDELMEGWE